MLFNENNKTNNIDKGIYLILDFVLGITSLLAYIFLAYNVYTYLIGLTNTICMISIFFILPCVSVLILDKKMKNEKLKRIILCSIKTFSAIIGSLFLLDITKAYIPISHRILYSVFLIPAILSIIAFAFNLQRLTNLFNEIISNITIITLTYIAYSIMDFNTFIITSFLIFFPKLFTEQKKD